MSIRVPFGLSIHGFLMDNSSSDSASFSSSRSSKRVTIGLNSFDETNQSLCCGLGLVNQMWPCQEAHCGFLGLRHNTAYLCADRRKAQCFKNTCNSSGEWHPHGITCWE